MKKWGFGLLVAAGMWAGCSSENAEEPSDPVDASSDAPTDASPPMRDARAADAADASRGPRDARADANDPPDAHEEEDAATNDASSDGGLCRIDGVDHAGTTVGLGDITAASTCAHGLATPARWATLPSAEFTVASCNACARVTGNLGSAVVTLIEKCNGACGGHTLEIDHDTLADVTTADAGLHSITWQLAPCEATGNLRYDLEGSNSFYVKLRVSNHENPLAGIEMREHNGAFQVLTRTSDNYWILQTGGPFDLPLEVRATDSFGQTVLFEVASFESGVVTETTVQFATQCAP